MAALKEADFYYGAVLSTLLNNKINPVIVECGNDRQVYDFSTNDIDFRLFVKYRSSTIDTKAPDYSSWQFVFSQQDIDELSVYLQSGKTLSLGLICGDVPLRKSKYAVLHSDDIQALFAMKKKSITIGIKKGERAFRISIGGGRANSKKIKSNRLF